MTATAARADDAAFSSEDPLPDSAPSLATSVRKGAIWSVASKLLLRFSSLFITAIIAHILDPKAFGVFAVALTAYAIVSSLGELGVASCLIRADLDIDALAPTMTTISVGASVVLAASMAIFARPIASALGSAQAAAPIRVMALTMIGVGVFAVPSAQLVRDFKQDKLFLAEALSFIPSTVMLLLLAKYGSGALAFAWSRAIGQLASGFVVVAWIPRLYRPGLARRALSVLAKFGLPLAGANLVNYVLLNVDYALVGHLIGAVALGTYVLAFNLASWPAGLLGAMINNVSMPAFSRVKHDMRLLRSSITDAVGALALVVMPICGLMMALARPLVLTLYGGKWAASATPLLILTLYGAVSIACSLFANILASLGRTRVLLVVQLVWLGALFPAMTLGVHRDGTVGAAIAHVAIIAPIVLPVYLFALKRAGVVRFGPLVRAALPSFLSACAAAGAAIAVALQFGPPLVQLVAGLAAGGLVYALAVAPQIIAFLNRGWSNKLTRVLRLYNNVARPGPLDSRARGRHVRRLGEEEPGYRDIEETGRVRASPAEQLTALGVLMSLATPTPIRVGETRQSPMTTTGPLAQHRIPG